MSNADLDYNFSSSVTDNDNTKDPDHSNIPILKQQLRDVDDAIKLHNSFDVIDINLKVSVENQIIAHKLFVNYLRGYRNDLKDKLEELGNG